jgi:hypothetical protein
MVIGPVDALFGIPADQVHAVAVGHRPGHFRARDRQRRARLPAALHGGSRRRAVGDGLLGVDLGQVDSTRLIQALELALVVPVMLRANETRQGQRRGGGEPFAATCRTGRCRHLVLR